VKGIHREVRYDHPPELVWRALTDPTVLAKWLMNAEGLEARVGCSFRFRMPPKPGFDGVIYCTVKEAEPCRRFVYTWASGRSLKRPTTVAWTLHPDADGTRLVLDHDGFEGLSGFLLRAMLGGGWARKMERAIPPLLDDLGARELRERTA